MLKSVVAGLLWSAPLWLLTGLGLDSWGWAGVVAAAGAATGPAVRAARRHPAAARVTALAALVLGVEAAGVVLLVFGIRQFGDFEPSHCDPGVEDCVVVGSGTPEEVVEEQRDAYTEGTWVAVVAGAALTLMFPVSFALGAAKVRRRRHPRRARPFPDHFYDMEETDRRDGHLPG
ncbi:hypothetical protein ACFYYH_18790 [Streptomyces sp. NPDC002018]|uniref:hypothetical protein n=1 Tax=Streptomyces sp. NPDC002018 TaxID=3364629 RepID=UPI0036BAF5CE